MENNDVFDAFGMTIEEIEEIIETLREEGAEAFRREEFDSIELIKTRIEEIRKFNDRVRGLQKEWKQLFAVEVTKPLESSPKKRTKVRRLEKGLRTPEDYFRRPILEALVELGGSALMRDVLCFVYNKIEGRLNEHDFKKLYSTGQVRWKNTAQWCRNSLVQEGYLAADSPRGIWTISEEGKKLSLKWEKGNKAAREKLNNCRLITEGMPCLFAWICW